MNRFFSIMQPTRETLILDIGGYPGSWEDSKIQSKIILLNLPKFSSHQPNNEKFEYVYGDGRKMDYLNAQFDIVFSNSVIEHLGNFEDQKKFAAEAQRVGVNYWIQTPAKEFFLDPHLLTPFMHWLPFSIIPKLLRYFTVWGILTSPSREEAEKFWEDLKLRPISYREMKILFPKAEIIVERFLGMPKSYIAKRKI
jgi:hypothetical protein